MYCTIVMLSQIGLLELFCLECLLVGLSSVHTLDTQVTSTPGSKKLNVVIVIGFEVLGLMGSNKINTKLSNSVRSSFLTSVIATAVAVFWWTSFPSLALS